MGLIGFRVHGEFVAPRIVLVLFTLAIDASLGHGTRDSSATYVGVQQGVFVSCAVRKMHGRNSDICTVVKDAFLAGCCSRRSAAEILTVFARRFVTGSWTKRWIKLYGRF